MIIVCEPSVKADGIGQILASELVVPVRVYDSLPGAALALAAAPGATVVLGPGLPTGDALSFAATATAQAPRPDIVLMRPDISPRSEALARRAGIRSVIRDHDDLVEVCRPLYSDRSRPEPSRRVTAVLGARGGVGASVTAANLAVALGRRSRHSVCLVDLDLAPGDLSIMLAASLPPASATGASEAVPLTGHGLDTEVAYAAPRELTDGPGLLTSVRTLASSYDYTLIDFGPFPPEQSFDVLELADLQLLVTTPELPAVEDLRRTLDLLDTLGHQDAVREVVVNRAERMSGMGADDVSELLDTAVTGTLPASRWLPASVNSGVPLLVSGRDPAYSRAVEQLCSRWLAGNTSGR